MAIALNTRNGVREGDFNASRRTPLTVPGPAVWDTPERVYSSRYSRGSQGRAAARVRTLTVENRTYRTNRSERVSSSAADRDAARALARLEKSRENRKNYLLGAVFGCALFVGTVFAGMTGLEPEVAQGGTSQVETVQAVVVAK